MATVLVTGGNGGFGRACAVRFAAAGHAVVATVRSAEGAAVVADDAARAGVSVTTVRLDVTDDASVTVGVAEATSIVGAIDVLVNNAGVLLPGSIELTPDDAVRATFEANYFGPLRLLRAVLPSMRERGRGAVVNVSSRLGHVPAPFSGHYAASKQALEALTEALAVELAGTGVRVATVIPAGIYPTAMAEARAAGGRPTPYDDLEDRLLERRRRRLAAAGDLREIADAVLAAAFAEPSQLHVTSRPLGDPELTAWLAGADGRVAGVLADLGLAPAPVSSSASVSAQ